jgi:hypothetical protein
VAGCWGPQITRRYKSATWATTDKSFVDVSAFVVAPPGSPAPQPAVLQLSSQGQKALIEALAANASDNSKLFTQLSGSFGGDESSSTIDHTRYHKRVVLSVVRNADTLYSPADRISGLTISLYDLTNGSFLSWDRFSTKYDTVDLGKLTLAKNNQIDLKLTGQAPAGAAAPLGGSLDYTTSHNQSEEVVLRQRYVVLTGTLNSKQATLTEQGVMGIDLVGTSTIDVDVTTDAMPPGNYVAVLGPLRHKNKWTPPDQIILNWKEFIFPKSCAPMTFTLRGNYTVRKVENNDDTMTESDDRVVFLRGTTLPSNPIVLVGSKELAALVWRVVSRDGTEVSVEDLQKGPLHFSSYDQAIQFLTWLNQTRSLLLAGRTLQIGSRKLTHADIPSLTVEVMRLNQCGL